MTNEYESVARYRKAEKIADAIERLEIFNTDDIAAMSWPQRRLIEEFADVRPASNATWALVTEVLRTRTKVRRLADRWQPADPFAGLS